MTLSLRRTLPAVLLVGSLTFLLGGCGPKYTNDLTPELASLTRSEQQDANLYARVIDNNTRSAWDDLARLFLLDENSSLNTVNLP
ncbi:MAG: hypothetical protein AAFX76_08020 [Planctomycetota bacterium]